MDERIIREQYGILETTYSDELQRIYIAEDVTKYNIDKLIINEIEADEIALLLKSAFDEQAIASISNFVDAFYHESKLYIVGKPCGGTPFNEYISENSLRLSDKMYIADSFLTYFSKLDAANPILRHIFCNPECISIVGRRNICINVNFKPSVSDMNADSKSAICRGADLLCSLFSNTVGATLEKDKDNVPPSILNTLKKCYEGQYNSFAQVHKDFKTSLLYSTFIEGTSVGKQIMKNMKKAKRRKSVSLIRRVVILFVLGAVLAGAWLLRDTPLVRGILTGGALSQEAVTKGENHVPTAKFSTSKSKIEVGDEVVFVSESTDPDSNDSIKSYEWKITDAAGYKKIFGNEQSARYTFTTEGSYTVSLTVKDSKGSSSTYSFSFKVSAKEDIPDSTGDSTGEGDAK